MALLQQTPAPTASPQDALEWLKQRQQTAPGGPPPVGDQGQQGDQNIAAPAAAPTASHQDAYDWFVQQQQGGKQTQQQQQKQETQQTEQQKQWETPPSTVGAFLSGMAGNAPGSWAEVLANYAHPFIHPLDAVTGIVNAIGSTTGPGRALAQQQAQVKAQAEGRPVQFSDVHPALTGMYQDLMNRYGSWENFKKTAYNDPVGVLADLSALAEYGEGGFNRLGAALPAGTAADIAKTSARGAGAISRYTNPVGLTVKAAEALAHPTVGIPAAYTIGELTSAKGPSVAETFTQGAQGKGGGILGTKPTPEFADALHGRTTISQIANEVGDRAVEFRNKMQNDFRNSPIWQNMRGQTLDMTNAERTMRQELDNFGVQIKMQPGAPIPGPPLYDQYGNLLPRPTGPSVPVVDFSGPRNEIHVPAEQDAIRRLVQDVLVDQPSKTPMMNAAPSRDVHSWKVRLDQDYRAADGGARAIIGRVRQSVREPLSAVQGYDNEMKRYQQADEFLNNYKGSLGAGPRAQLETAIRKISYAMNPNNPTRLSLIDQMDKELGSHLRDQIAGAAMNHAMPRGFIGRGFMASEALYGLYRAISSGDLSKALGEAGMTAAGLGATALMTSPRIMGETALKAGQLYGLGRRAATLPPSVYRTMMFAQQPSLLPPAPPPQ